MSKTPYPTSPTGIYATQKWVYSGLVQFHAQEDPTLAQVLNDQGDFHKTYYWSETDPYAFNSPQEIDAYLTETAQEFLSAMQAGQQEAYIAKRSQEQKEAEEEGLKIKSEVEK